MLITLKLSIHGEYHHNPGKYQIQSVPTLMLFRKGEVLWRMSGALPKAELLSHLDPFLR